VIALKVAPEPDPRSQGHRVPKTVSLLCRAWLSFLTRRGRLQTTPPDEIPWAVVTYQFATS
jgi:hypothetical protein